MVGSHWEPVVDEDDWVRLQEQEQTDTSERGTEKENAYEVSPRWTLRRLAPPGSGQASGPT